MADLFRCFEDTTFLCTFIMVLFTVRLKDYLCSEWSSADLGEQISYDRKPPSD